MPAVSNINFNIHRRAFVKKYSAGLSGPAKFTLLVAYLAKGRLRVNIALVDVKGLWNSMSGLLGGKLKTGIYGTRAKEKEWLDSAKREMYNLTQKWQGIFK